MPNHSNTDIAALRRNYTQEALSKSEVRPNPFEQFGHWFEEALRSALPEPNAMTLATANLAGQPSARTVLLKGFDEQGFVFFTNYESRKGQELTENPQAALLFCWLELERQVRIEGKVERVTPEESKAYFQSRPKSSQIGAWASPQSKVIAWRGVLDARMQEIAATYQNEEVLPLPSFWGGFRLRPQQIEFWQGRESRLHDRILYSRSEENWRLDRLAP